MKKRRRRRRKKREDCNLDVPYPYAGIQLVEFRYPLGLTRDRLTNLKLDGPPHARKLGASRTAWVTTGVGHRYPSA